MKTNMTKLNVLVLIAVCAFMIYGAFAEAAPTADAKVDTAPVSATADAKPEVKDADTKTAPEEKTAAVAKTEPAAETKTVPETKADTATVPASDAKPEVKTEPTADVKAETTPAPAPVAKPAPAPVAKTAPASTPISDGASHEHTLWSNILHSFGPDGTVNLTALMSNLNDPNLEKLTRALGKANFTKLEKTLSSPRVDIGELMDTLREYEMLDETKSLLNDNESYFMRTLERWAAKLGEVRDRVFHPRNPFYNAPAGTTTRPVELPTTTYTTPTAEQSPMLKKSLVNSQGGEEKTVDIKSNEKEDAQPADESIVVRQKKEAAPGHKTYGDADVHFPHLFARNNDKQSEEDSHTEAEWDLVVVWLIVCVGVAAGLLLGVILFKLACLTVSKLRSDKLSFTAQTPDEPNSHFIAV